MINLKKVKKYNSGFTLFVSMIVASLLLAVGFSIGNIILKQLLLAGSGKDSQIAFYAADSGAECAQFWDARDGSGASLPEESPFATSTYMTTENPMSSADIKCGNGAVVASKVVTDTNATTTLVINFTHAAERYSACALVVIEKGFNTTVIETAPIEIPFTRITSRGYNSSPTSGGDSCDTSNPRTVERGLFIQY